MLNIVLLLHTLTVHMLALCSFTITTRFLPDLFLKKKKKPVTFFFFLSQSLFCLFIYVSVVDFVAPAAVLSPYPIILTVKIILMTIIITLIINLYVIVARSWKRIFSALNKKNYLTIFGLKLWKLSFFFLFLAIFKTKKTLLLLWPLLQLVLNALSTGRYLKL